MDSRSAILRAARRAASFAWELPQNVLGLSFLAAQLARGGIREARFERERLMIELVGDGAVSLGLFVFWTTRDNKFVPVASENKAHEYGHSIQSRWLGPLYLPLVGVPSSLRVAYAVAYYNAVGRRWQGYYDGYPERWADRLGGVDPSGRPR